MLKFTKSMVQTFALFALCLGNANAQTANTHPKFIILNIAEQPPYVVAENTTEQGGGDVWDKTKEISSDVWDGTKEVGSDVWDGAKKVTGDMWDGAKEVGGDVKDGISGENSNNAATTDNNNHNKK